MKLVLKKNALQMLTAAEANSVGGGTGILTDGCPTEGTCPTVDCTVGLTCPSVDTCTNYVCDTAQWDCTYDEPDPEATCS